MPLFQAGRGQEGWGGDAGAGVVRRAGAPCSAGRAGGALRDPIPDPILIPIPDLILIPIPIPVPVPRGSPPQNRERG